jgi:tyrosyl-tRNA synthetase
MLPVKEIAALVAEHAVRPNERLAQKKLAHEVTAMIHGAKAAEGAARISEILFGSASFASLSKAEIEMLKKDAPSTKIAVGTSVIDALVASELAASKGEARRLIEQKGISLNDIPVVDVAYMIGKVDTQNGLSILRRGKKVVILVSGK